MKKSSAISHTSQVHIYSYGNDTVKTECTVNSREYLSDIIHDSYIRAKKTGLQKESNNHRNVSG